MYEDSKEVTAPVRDYKDVPSLDEIISSIPGVVLDILRKYPGAVLAGGAIRAIYDNIPSKDYDIFFTDQNDYDDLNHKCLVKYRLVKATPNNDLREYLIAGHRIQLVRTKIYGTQQEILNDFDFVCNKFALWFHTGLKVPAQFARHAPGQEFKLLAQGTNDAMIRKLTIANVHHSLTTFERIQEFRNRGYKIKDDEFRKFLAMAGDPKIPLRKDWSITNHHQAAASIPQTVAYTIPGSAGAGSSSQPVAAVTGDYDTTSKIDKLLDEIDGKF